MIVQIIDFFRRSLKARDIRKKLVITFLVLIVFRLAAHIPAAGIDRASLQAMFTGSSLLSLLDVFSGGTLANFSILALGLTPYINSSIIFQLLSFVIPKLEELSKEGEYGQEKINQYSRLLTIPLSIVQSFGMFALLRSRGVISAVSPLEIIALVLTMVAGTMFAIWLGELITEYGLGNGVSFLIFVGIIARLPITLTRSVTTFQSDDLLKSLVFITLGIVIIGLVVFINEATRQIPVQYARRSRQALIPQVAQSHIPLRVNQAGVIPIIFAVSLVLAPSLIGQFLSSVGNPDIVEIASKITLAFNPQSALYNVLYFSLVVGFTYFYTSVVFNPEKIAENLQKNGAFIPGVRPGEQTMKYLNKILQRVTLVGAVFLGLIAILPSFFQSIIGISGLVIGGTGILIVVSVILEMTRQLEAQLVMNRYEGILR